MVSRRILYFLLSCVLSFCAALPLQAFATEFHGQVTFSGSPVLGSVITVTATQGSKTETAVTNDVGVFSFADLSDGTWTLTIQMTGFEPVKQQIVVGPGQPSPRFELKLQTLAQIASQDKPTEISGAAEAAAAQSATPPAEVPNAPAANGKKGQQAASGPTPAPSEPSNSQTNEGLLINGSVNNAATSEYSLSQAFGNNRNTRSLYNGQIRISVANSALNATPTNLYGPSVKPTYNNFVGNIMYGGPLKIPHLLPPNNPPYFFILYARTQDTTANTATGLMPTTDQRGGNLSSVSKPIYAPATGLSSACLASGVTPGAPFTGNIIPSACISPVAKYLLDFYPLPNQATINQVNYSLPTPSSTRGDTFRGQLQRSFGRKDYVNGNITASSTRTGTNSIFGFHDSVDIFNLSVGLNWSHRFTPRLGMNLNYNFSRARDNSIPYFAHRTDVEAQAGINGVYTDPVDPGLYWGPPSLGFTTGFSGLGDGISSSNRPETNAVGVRFDWNKFRHNVAGGFDFRRQEWNNATEVNPRGGFNFTGAATQTTGVLGGDFADFLLGIPDTSQIAYGDPNTYLRGSVYDLYVRDDFRVNPEFTVNFGMRWDYQAPVTETKNRLVNVDIAPGFVDATPVLATSPVGALTGQSYPTSLVRPDKNGFSPNVSIAWRPISGSSLVLRANYQIAYDTSVYQRIASHMATQAPLYNTLNLSNAVCPITLANGFGNCAAITPYNFAIDPNFRLGYVQVWNAVVQRDLPFAMQMTATYRGTKGTHGEQEILPNTYAPGGSNQCPAGYSCPSGYAYLMSGGNLTREEGILYLRRRLRSGFTAGITYTYSKSLDDYYAYGGQGAIAVGSVSGGTSARSGTQVAQDWRNPNQGQRGLSNFDQRNLLNANVQYTTGMGIGGKTLLSGWRGLLYKEWTIQTSIVAGSGLPETPYFPETIPGTALTTGPRADITGQPIYGSSTSGQFLNPAAFAAPAAGQWGNARRNSIIGPDVFTMNAQMSRNFKLHARYNLETEFAANNILNHATFSSYYTNILNPAQFGTVVGYNQARTITAYLNLRF